jgi:hypothetical protein
MRYLRSRIQPLCLNTLGRVVQDVDAHLVAFFLFRGGGLQAPLGRVTVNLWKSQGGV